jgi:hypothetical protein
MVQPDGYLPSEQTFDHPSETALRDTAHDYRIDNNGDDPAALYRQLDALIATLRALP